MPCCCVPGCDGSEKLRRRFPIGNKHLFDEWVRRVQSPKFKGLSDRRIHETCYVCNKHFNPWNSEKMEHWGSQRLRFGSVPTIGVPGFKGPPTRENSFIYYKDVHKDKQNDALENEQPQIQTPNLETNDSQKENVTSKDSEPQTTMPNFEVNNTQKEKPAPQPRTNKSYAQIINEHKKKPVLQPRTNKSNLGIPRVMGATSNNTNSDDILFSILNNQNKRGKSTSESNAGSVIMDVLIQDEIEHIDETAIEYDELFEPLRALFGEDEDQTQGNVANDATAVEEDENTTPLITDLEASLRFHSYAKPTSEIVCRFCAKPVYWRKSHEIFQNSLLEKKIRFCYPFLSILKDDGLPQILCLKCTRNLDTIYEHFNVVRQNDTTLRGFVKTNTIISDDKSPSLQNDPDKLCIQLVVERNGKHFTCPFCTKKFLWKTGVMNHVTSAHTDEDPLEDTAEGGNETNSHPDETVDIPCDPGNKALDESNLSHTEEHANPTDDNFINTMMDDDVGQMSHQLENESYVEHVTLEENYDDIAVENLLITNNKRRKNSRRIEDEIAGRTCHKCQKIFNSRNVKLKHDRRNHNTFQCYRCSICSEAFCNTEQITSHSVSCHEMAVETETLRPIVMMRLYECDHCCRVFTTTSALDTHRSTCKLAMEDSYQCYCSKAYKSYSCFVSHLSSHKSSLNKMSDPQLERPTCRLYSYCPYCRKIITNFNHHMMSSHPIELNLETEQKKRKKWTRNINKKRKISTQDENLTSNNIVEDSTPPGNNSLHCNMFITEI